MIFLNSQLKRWKKAGLIDESMVNKLYAFEVERWTKILIRAAKFLGLPLIGVATILVLLDTLTNLGSEYGTLLSLLGVSLLFFGSFMWFLSKNKIKRDLLVPTLISFALGAVLLTYILFSNSSPTYLAIADWIALGVVLFFLSQGKKKPAILFGFAYLAGSLAYQEYAFGKIEGGLDSWIILFVSSWRSLYLAASIGVIWFVVKVVIPVLRFLRVKLRQLALYVGLERTIAVVIFTAMTVLGSFRNELADLGISLGTLDLEVIGVSGLYITLLTLLPKERPSFSMVFCIFGWIEIITQAIVTSRRNAVYVFDEISYDPGPLLIAATVLTVFIIISTFTAKKNESTADVIGLGPVGFVTFVILVASMRL